MNREFIRKCKNHIDKNDLDGLKELLFTLQEDETSTVAWDILFKDTYIHACLKNKPEIIEWLEELYKEMDPFHQVALRTVFPYGRALLKKAQQR